MRTDDTLKHCYTCGEDKPRSEFHRRAASGDGLANMCKACNTTKVREWAKANRERSRENRRRYRKRHPDRVLDTNLRSRLKRYGITISQYQAAMDRQVGLCAVCQVEMDPACVDHDHETGRFRGLLCAGCNYALGCMSDDPDRLRRAAEYLEACRAY